MATICNLPPELKHLIITWVCKKDNAKFVLKALTLTCKCLRAVSIEPLFAYRRGAIHFRRLVSVYEVVAFLRDKPQTAAAIYSVRLSGSFPKSCPDTYPTPILDDVVISHLVALLPNLKHLTISGFRFVESAPVPAVPEPPSSPPTTGPFRLNSLTLRTGREDDVLSDLPAVFRVLSLFNAPVLDTQNFWNSCDAAPVARTDTVHRPLHFAAIDFDKDCVRSGGEVVPSALYALAVHLAPGVLKKFEVECDTPEVVQAVGRLLTLVGSNLTVLSIGSQRLANSDDDGWETPLDGTHHSLITTTCTS